MELPYGAAYLRPLRRPGVLIAGGTGIAPMPPIVVADDASWLGAAGLMTDALADRIGAPEKHEFYVSGPPVWSVRPSPGSARPRLPVIQIHHDTVG